MKLKNSYQSLFFHLFSKDKPNKCKDTHTPFNKLSSVSWVLISRIFYENLYIPVMISKLIKELNLIYTHFSVHLKTN